MKVKPIDKSQTFNSPVWGSFATTSAAFTIVELLTVTAIISILAAMLMTGLKGARNAAQNIACISNLKQLGLAFQQYAADHDGWLPAPLWTNTGEPYAWPRLLQQTKYLSYSWGGILKCPSERTGFEGYNEIVNFGYASGYTMNGYLGSSSGTNGSAGQLTDHADRTGDFIVLVDGGLNSSFSIYDMDIKLAYRHSSSLNILFLDSHVSHQTRPLSTTDVRYGIGHTN